MAGTAAGWLLTLAIGLASTAPAACGDQPGDMAGVADARAAVEAACGCAAAPDRGTWRRCARAVLTLRRTQGTISKACASAARRCATRSTCGSPGAVTCCRAARDEQRCKVSRSADACTRSGGTPRACPSCCDACTDACLPSSCGNSAAPTCGGECPAGSSCAFDSIPDWFRPRCACYPDDVVPCSQSGYPTCGGACLDGGVCQHVSYREFPGGLGFDVCVCVPPASACAGGPQQCSAPGRCPPGEICQLAAGPPDFALFCAGCAVPTTTTSITVPTTPTTTTTTAPPTTTIPGGSCGAFAFPTCGGTCPPGDRCNPGRVVIDGALVLESCVCRAAEAVCAGSELAACAPPGACPSGAVCVLRVDFGPPGRSQCGCEPS